MILWKISTILTKGSNNHHKRSDRFYRGLGQVNEESGKATANGRESADDVVSSGSAKNTKAMFEESGGSSPVSAREPSEEVEPTKVRNWVV